MKFFDILNNLKEQHINDNLVRNNGTVLLGPGNIPNYRHMLFRPLSDEHIESYLISEYKNTFPQDYINFLKYSNGANLYTVRIKTKKFQFAHPMFVIFGLPMTPPFGRPANMEEPFDIRVEDLGRHDDIPNTWLKCGTYSRNCDFDAEYDIFIDTVTNQVFSCERNKKDVVDSWDNLDDCLCSIAESLADSELEYECDF